MQKLKCPANFKFISLNPAGTCTSFDALSLQYIIGAIWLLSDVNA